jgi:transcriptional regulatory protein LEU3
MSSSVFFDCLWILREQVGMIKLNPNQKSNQSGESSNNDQNDDDDYDDDDDVFDSDEAAANDKSITDPGTAGSESSDVRSTTSSQKKRPRSLSNNFKAE